MYKMELIGNLTQDPVMNEVEINGTTNKVCSFTVAANEGSGDRKRTIFARVSTWNKMAENCGMWLKKGREIMVVGEPKFSVYNANDGTTRINIDLRASEIYFLGTNNSNNQQQSAEPATAPAYDAPASSNDFQVVEANELPF